MVDFTWIQKSLFLVLMLQFTVTADETTNLFVRVGKKATLPCHKVIDDQVKCNGTTWRFFASRNNATVELIRLGQTRENIQTKPDRLRVLPNCSLVVKNVTVEDAGVYQCQQYKPGPQQGPEILDHQSGSIVHLSVVNLTEHKDVDVMTLNCSVFTYGVCRHTVKWLFNYNDAEKMNGVKSETGASESLCSTTASFVVQYFDPTANYTFWKCKVTDADTANIHRFSLRPQSSGDKTDDTKTAATASTTTTTTTTTTTEITTKSGQWWMFIIIAVGVIVLLIIVVLIIRWRKTEGHGSQTEGDAGLSFNPARTPSAAASAQDWADPEDGVAYVTVSYTKKTNSRVRAKVHGDDDDDDDEGDAVTYSTVKAPSSSAGATTDPSNLYATVNKPNNQK